MPDRAASGNPVPAATVRSMFDRIAPVYDVMNTVMTAGLDARWRRSAALATRLRNGDRAVDVACGSGALTRELAAMTGVNGDVTGIDLSERMLEQARQRPAAAGAAASSYLVADAMDLPLPDASVDAATIAFGLRNVPDYGRCLREMLRVTRPGGRIVVLEIATPERGIGRLLAATWFERVIPVLGRLAGGGSAYRYLPESVGRYPPPSAIALAITEAGAVRVRWRRLRPGLVTLHVAERA